MTGYGTTGSIANMFRQASFAQQCALAQIKRVSEAANPVEALFGEKRIYTEASDGLREIIAPRVFRAVPALLDGNVSEFDFVTALGVMLRIDFWDSFQRMSRVLLGCKSHAGLLMGAMGGTEPVGDEELRKIAERDLPLSDEERLSLLLMGAYSAVHVRGGVEVLDEFPAQYIPSVRTALLLEVLTGETLVDSMFPLAQSYDVLVERATQVGIAEHAQPLFEEACQLEQGDEFAWMLRWSRYLEMSGRQYAASDLVAQYQGSASERVPQPWLNYLFSGDSLLDGQTSSFDAAMDARWTRDARVQYESALLRLQLDALSNSGNVQEVEQDRLLLAIRLRGVLPQIAVEV